MNVAAYLSAHGRRTPPELPGNEERSQRIILLWKAAYNGGQ